jgi:hypothetical protein
MGQENRMAQDDYQIYVCLSNSLTKEAKDKMLLSKSEFTIEETQLGVMFLKCIISASHVDTNATIRITRERLSNVDKYIGQVDSDITNLNEYVKNLLDSLAARGATTEDLLANLFKGYAAASDKEFCKYIKKKQEEYDDGIDITAEELMVMAENKYKAMVENSTWNAPDEQAEQIIALQAQVKKLASAGKQKSQGGKGKPNANPESKQKGKEAPKGGNNRKPDGMLKKPADGQPKTKKVNNKTYHWCPNHQSWTIHTPAECKGKGASPAPAVKGKSVS